MKYKFVGLDLAPFSPNPNGNASQMSGLFEDPKAWRGTSRATEQAPGAVLVFADATGDTMAIIPGSPQPVPWIAGDEQGPAVGLTPSTKLDGLAKSGGPAGSPQASRSAIATILKSALAAQADNKEAAPGGAQQGPAPAGDPSLEEDLRKQAPQIAAGAAFGAAAGILNDLAGGADFVPASISAGLAGGVLSAAAAFAYKKLLPDPDASTAEWAAFMAGPKILSAVFGSGEFRKLCGAPGPYSSQALRVGDADESGNKITSGCASVIIEGKPAARVDDLVEKDGQHVLYGALLTKIGGQCAGRAYGALGWGSKSEAGKFMAGAPRTLIGGARTFDVATNDFPPLPGEVSDASAKVKGSHGLPAPFRGVPDPENPNFPTEPGIYFDPNLGEYRIWDAAGSKGWSATLAELSNLNTWSGWSAVFEAKDGSSWLNRLFQTLHLADPEQKGNWYALGGMWDLGSPLFPGAGNGSVWFIPDSAWGIDMSSYYQFHDWIFRPTSDGYRNNMGWWDQILEVEWPAYLEGASHHGINPFGQALQIIYSTATTIIGFTEWAKG